VIWVAAQTVLMGGVIATWFFPPRLTGLAPHVAGAVLLAAGAVLFVAARLAMGHSFTIFPWPRKGGQLITSGPFRIVRNPIYLAALLCLVGGSLLHGSWTGLALIGALAVLWAAKVRVEERYLAERFPEYEDYRARVRYRILPFLY
jgi:protein-S-isoprenylcysteine O-methyltransferase Ste14